MSDSFLPSMRQMVAAKLKEQGYSQGRIASMLGITQASVSLYLSRRTSPHRALDRLGVSREDADVYASLLAEDLKKDPVYAVNTLYSIWSGVLGRGGLCAAHRSLYPSLAHCDMCMTTFGARERDRGAQDIEHVADAVKMIEGSSIFVRVMPQVSVNIAYAAEGASSVQDVVAVPGRIVKVKGTARSFMRPEHGASTHVASVLLTMISRDPSLRAAINIRYDSMMAAALRSLGIRTIDLEASAGRTDAEMLQALRERLWRSSSPIDAVIDEGGAGIEPGLYLFASDAVKVAELALRLARMYVAQT